MDLSDEGTYQGRSRDSILFRRACMAHGIRTFVTMLGV